jgi:glycosyltransferase involved in cell wall biosynthesis
VTQVIVPAHNEAAVIGRCLESLLRPPSPEALEVIVVCNGCTDGTPEVARSFGPRVRVLETTEASKALALDLGDQHATGFPRLYVDGDVELLPGSLLALAAALDRPGVHAVAPRRRLDLTGASRAARSYFAIWQRLDSVRDGLSGRGVYGFSAQGRARFGRFEGILADDLYVHTLFADGSFCIVDGAEVVVRVPRDLRTIARRRARTLNLRNRLAETHPELRAAIPGSPGAWTRVVRDDPRMAVHAPAFVVAALAARVVARHLRTTGRQETWVRDETSRAGAVGPTG